MCRLLILVETFKNTGAIYAWGQGVYRQLQYLLNFYLNLKLLEKYIVYLKERKEKYWVWGPSLKNMIS